MKSTRRKRKSIKRRSKRKSIKRRSIKRKTDGNYILIDDECEYDEVGGILMNGVESGPFSLS
jgi:hypothetical protein